MLVFFVVVVEALAAGPFRSLESPCAHLSEAGQDSKLPHCYCETHKASPMSCGHMLKASHGLAVFINSLAFFLILKANGIRDSRFFTAHSQNGGLALTINHKGELVQEQVFLSQQVVQIPQMNTPKDRYITVSTLPLSP